MSKPLLISAELSPEHQLRQFCHFRWGLIAAELLAAFTGWLIDYPIHSWTLLLLAIFVHALSNLSLTLLPGHHGYGSRVFSFACLADVLFISILLALSGGAGNGLAAMLLLPVAVAAVLLPAAVSYLLAVIAIVAYSILLLPADMTGISAGVSEHAVHSMHHHSDDGMSFGQHILQMWWAFTLSALLISWFVSSQAALIRKKSQQLNLLQQQQLRQEQMLVVATYAANAAHDLATPIQNISLLVEELAADLPEHEAMNDLQQQVKRCQNIVQQLRQNAGQLRDRNRGTQPLLSLVQQSIQNWLVSRPDISASMQVQSDDSECLIADDISLAAALFNILDNAADAGVVNQQPRLDISVRLRQKELQLKIRDFGEGLSAQRLAELGKIPQQSEHGLGLGQFLANVSIEHLGGQISRHNLADSGMETLIQFKGE